MKNQLSKKERKDRQDQINGQLATMRNYKKYIDIERENELQYIKAAEGKIKIAKKQIEISKESLILIDQKFKSFIKLSKTWIARQKNKLQ